MTQKKTRKTWEKSMLPTNAKIGRKKNIHISSSQSTLEAIEEPSSILFSLCQPHKFYFISDITIHWWWIFNLFVVPHMNICHRQRPPLHPLSCARVSRARSSDILCCDQQATGVTMKLRMKLIRIFFAAAYRIFSCLLISNSVV